MRKRVALSPSPLFASSKEESKASDQIIKSIKDFASSKGSSVALPSSSSLFARRVVRSPEIVGTPKGVQTSPRSVGTGRTSLRAEKYTIFVLSENRAREVGMAALNIKSHEIHITQFADSQHYSYTLELVHAFSPTTIVLPSTGRDSSLHKAILNSFPDVPVLFTERKYYNETQGLKVYNSAIKHRTIIDIEHKFTCLASLAALFRYLESSESLVLTAGATKVDYYFLEQIMHVDYRSSLKLELVMNLQHYTVANSLLSLFETRTVGGRRLLRMNILHPLSDSVLIKSRLQLVEELLKDEEKLLALVGLLPKFRDFELYTGRFSQGVKCDSLPWTRQLVILPVA